MLFTNADADSRPFNQFADDLAKRLWPQYPIQDLPDTHEIYNVLYQCRLKLPLRAVSNGSRLLMIHSPTDMSAKWQFKESNKAQPQFELWRQHRRLRHGQAPVAESARRAIPPAAEVSADLRM